MSRNQNEKRSKNRALTDVCPYPGKAKPLGDNNLTYGDNSDYVRVSLDTNGTCGQYELLRIKHVKDSRVVDAWVIDLTAERHKPLNPEHMNNASPDVKGGYYWSSNSKWYNYVPIKVASRVQEILDFTGAM